MKKSVLIGIILFLSSSLFATQTFIGLSAGPATFSDKFDTGVSLMGRLGFRAPSGIILEGNIGYIEAKSSVDGLDTLQMVPVLVGATYSWDTSGNTKPYVGALAGAAVVGGDYDSTLILYGGKIGILYNLKRQSSLYGEIEYLSGHDDSQNIDIQPLSIRLGVAIGLNQHQMKPGPKPKNPHPKKPHPAGRRPGRPRF